MRREQQLILIVLILVAGPTALLSFLAARTLRNWDAVMEKQWAVTAQRDLTAIAAELQARLAASRYQLAQAAAEASTAEHPADALLDIGARLTRIDSLADWICVYQPGAGMVYPPALSRTASSAEESGFAVRGNEELATLLEAAQRLQYAGALQAAIEQYLAILSRPVLPRNFRCAALLGLAQSRRQANQPAAAIEYLQTLLALVTVEPNLRDGEGNRFAFTARRELVEACRQAGQRQAAQAHALALLEELASRYPELIVDQRQSLRTYLADIQPDLAVPAAGLLDANAAEEIQRRTQQANLRLEEQVKNLDLRGRDRQVLADSVALQYPHAEVPGTPTWSSIQNRRWVWTPLDAGGLNLESVAGPDVKRDWIAGFRIDPGKLENALWAAMERRGGTGDLQFAVTAMPADLPIRSRGAATEQYLAKLELPPPLEGIVLAARPADVNAMRASAGLQARLYLWGILLLLGTLALGIWVATYQVTREIRQARTRSDFVAGVSHDLRTPLASMRMLAESLYLGHIEDSGMQKKFLGAMLKECDRLGQLTERALYFIRLGQDSLRFHRERGDVRALVREAATSFGIRFREGEREITVNAETELPPVLLDHTAIGQVVHNLIENAVKYSPDGGPIEVRVDADPGGGEVFFEVRDHGIGIDVRDRRRIFKRFVRGRDPRVQAIRGAGLGLALCRHIIEAHGGRIEVVCPPDGGSLFRVVLPVLQE